MGHFCNKKRSQQPNHRSQHANSHTYTFLGPYFFLSTTYSHFFLGIGSP